MLGQRVQRLNRDGLAKASRPGSLPSRVGHPRSATRAATPAPKDSQGCAVWYSMAQAGSAAAAAPRIRCAPAQEGAVRCAEQVFAHQCAGAAQALNAHKN